MTERKHLICLCLLILSAAALAVMSCPCRQEYRTSVFRTGNGWGYDIIHDGRRIIRQTCIPAISGNMPFPDRRSARKTADLVAERLASGLSPALTVNDIENIM